MEVEKRDLSLILKQSGFATGGRFLSLLLNYIYTIVATRILGASTFGIFILGRTVVQVSSLFGSVGLSPTLMRQISYYFQDNDDKKVQKLINFGIGVCLSASIIVAISVFILCNWIANTVFNEPYLSNVLKIFAIAIPFGSIVKVFYGIFKGLKKVDSKALIDSLVYPGFNLFLIICVGLLGFGLYGIIAAYIISFFIAGYFSEYIINSRTGYRNINGKLKKRYKKELFSYSLPLMLSSTIDFLQRWIDTLMLGMLSTTTAVGIYTISLRMATFVALPLVATNAIFSPLIAEIYSEKDFKRLENNYQTITKLVFTVSLLIFGFLLLYSKPLLHIFGKEFTAGSTAFSIICFGQLINASVGASGQMLIMTGRPNVNLYNSVFFIGVTIGLNYYLIPLYGIIGAGIANAVTLGSLNVIRVMQVKLYLGVTPFKKDYFYPIIIFLGAFYSSYLVQLYMKSYYLQISTLLIYVPLYLGGVYIFGLTKEEKIYWNNIFKKVIHRIK